MTQSENQVCQIMTQLSCSAFMKGLPHQLLRLRLYQRVHGFVPRLLAPRPRLEDQGSASAELKQRREHGLEDGTVFLARAMLAKGDNLFQSLFDNFQGLRTILFGP